MDGGLTHLLFLPCLHPCPDNRQHLIACLLGLNHNRDHGVWPSDANTMPHSRSHSPGKLSPIDFDLLDHIFSFPVGAEAILSKRVNAPSTWQHGDCLFRPNACRKHPHLSTATGAGGRGLWAIGY